MKIQSHGSRWGRSCQILLKVTVKHQSHAHLSLHLSMLSFENFNKNIDIPTNEVFKNHFQSIIFKLLPHFYVFEMTLHRTDIHWIAEQLCEGFQIFRIPSLCKPDSLQQLLTSRNWSIRITKKSQKMYVADQYRQIRREDGSFRDNSNTNLGKLRVDSHGLIWINKTQPRTPTLNVIK